MLISGVMVVIGQAGVVAIRALGVGGWQNKINVWTKQKMKYEIKGV